MARKKSSEPAAEYPPAVRARFDASRPRYTEAVKSLAAFCDGLKGNELVFRVLMDHLDAACTEAINKTLRVVTTAAARRKR